MTAGKAPRESVALREGPEVGGPRPPCYPRVLEVEVEMSKRSWAGSSFLALAFLLALPDRAFGMDRFSAPTGQLGANLTLDPAQRFRLHTETSYFTTSGAGGTQHLLGFTFGGAVKVADAVEIEVGVPVTGLIISGAASGDQWGAGNLAVGANYFMGLTETLRLKVGGHIAFGPWNQSNGAITTEGFIAALTGAATNGYQDYWLYLPGYVHVVVPARVEVGDTLQFTGDASLHLGIPTTDAGEADFIMTLAPGVAFWATPKFALGARLPLHVLTADDAAQLSFEPFLRFNLGEQGFLSTRFTMHLDENLGFAFDTGGAWGLHLAFGGSF